MAIVVILLVFRDRLSNPLEWVTRGGVRASAGAKQAFGNVWTGTQTASGSGGVLSEVLQEALTTARASNYCSYFEKHEYLLKIAPLLAGEARVDLLRKALGLV